SAWMVALKLARFKQIFPGAAKTDRLDARKILELFQVLILGTKFKTCPPKEIRLSNPQRGGGPPWCPGLPRVDGGRGGDGFSPL
ncbi:MAG TPA: hypothetical protein ENF32_03885, partial [Thermosulfidibacter takaii]|nr:hypothetical protein [Thermosulfidibacter takaii]